MQFAILQNRTVDFRRHIIRQELESYGFDGSSILESEDGEPCGVLALSSANEYSASAWVLMSRISNGYLFRASFPVDLSGLLSEGAGAMLQGPNGQPLTAKQSIGAYAFQVVNSDIILANVLALLVSQRPRRYATLPTFEELLSKVRQETPQTALSLAINEVRLTGRIDDLIVLAPGYRLRLILAHTDAEFQIDYQPIGDVEIPSLQKNDTVYVAGELATNRVIAFEIQKLTPS